MASDGMSRTTEAEDYFAREVEYYDEQMSNISDALYKESYNDCILKAESAALDARKIEINRMLAVYGDMYCRRAMALDRLRGERQ